MIHLLLNQVTQEFQMKIFGEITCKGNSVEKANKLPNDIDGLKHYVIKDEIRNNLLTKCKDRRKKMTRKQSGLVVTVYSIKTARDRHFAPTKNVCTTKNTRMKISFTSVKMDFAGFVVP